jgi:hypothetical protein
MPKPQNFQGWLTCLFKILAKILVYTQTISKKTAQGHSLGEHKTKKEDTVENTNNANARRVRLQLIYYLKTLAHF